MVYLLAYRGTYNIYVQACFNNSKSKLLIPWNFLLALG
jgi:hypothetical protein